ncbi:hypothetical protein ACFV4G_39715 [Kitasatospora sp. NPDC059747]|uniref:hypothetical protein n=1 Tax=Kitasatospora sp. NPDC059747 TaxID=3346930 RepID=UPI003647D3D9
MSPSTLYYSGNTFEQRPGRMTADVLMGTGSVTSSTLEIVAPQVVPSGAKSPSSPSLSFTGAYVDGTGQPTSTTAAGAFTLSVGRTDVLDGSDGSITGTTNQVILSAAPVGGGSAQLAVSGSGALTSKPLRMGSPYGSTETWQPVSYATGWADYGSPWQNVQCMRMPDGTVMLRGLFKATAGASGGHVFYLPSAAYYPVTRQIFKLATDNNTNANLFVYENGTVDINNASGVAGWCAIGSASWDTVA